MLGRTNTGSENLTAEIDSQETLIADIEEALVGKATGANATADKILSPYKAYVGKELITGSYIPQVVTIDGEVCTDNLELLLDHVNFELEKLPFTFYPSGSAVVFDGELHTIGGDTTGTTASQQHYKWNGSEWTSVGTLPYYFYKGSAVVSDGELYLLGGMKDYEKYFYKWDGSEWTSVGTLPYSAYSRKSVVVENEIHLLGFNSSGNFTNHCKWNGSEWVSVSTLPVNKITSATVLNNEIYIAEDAGNDTTSGKLYKWDGEAWILLCELPQTNKLFSLLNYMDEIYAMGFASSPCSGCYKLIGSGWSPVTHLPEYDSYSNIADSTKIVYQGEIHMLGGNGTSHYHNHYMLNVSVYRKMQEAANE